MKRLFQIAALIFALTFSLANAATPAPAEDPFEETFAGLPADLATKLDAIYYRHDTVEGHSIMIPTPSADIEKNLIELERAMPTEPILPLYRARVEITLGKYDDANKAMEAYLKLAGRNAESLGLMADYLHSRIQYRAEIKILEERAALYIKTGGDNVIRAKDDYYRIIEIIGNAAIKDLDPFAYHIKIVEAAPNDSMAALEYVAALAAAGRLDEALRETRRLSPRHPDMRRQWMNQEADILKQLKRPDEAVAVYSKLGPFDSVEMYQDYFALLHDLGRQGEYARSLETARAAVDPMDATTFAAWFQLANYAGETTKAAKGLDEWVAKLVAAGKLRDNLLLVGELLLQSGEAGRAGPYFYTAYVSLKSGAERERAIYGLFVSLVDGDSANNAFSNGAAPGEAFMGLDDLPSIHGGVFSLLLNDQSLDERFKDLAGVSGALRSRRLAERLLDEMRKNYPQSSRIPAMEWRVIETAMLYQDWETTEKLCIAFSKNRPNDPNYFEALFGLASSYAGRFRFQEEWKTYARILAEAASRKNDAVYARAFNQYVASLNAQKRYSDVLGLYWTEVGRNPDNEKLYEEFLKFVSSRGMYDEELKLYQRAIARFDKANWYQGMARWYLRNRGQESMRKITAEIRDKLDESELGSYLTEFAVVDWNSAGDAKNRFYLDSFMYAHRRFPHNLQFARGLINFYESFYNRKGLFEIELAALYAEYSVVDADIGARFMRYLVAKNKLELSVESIGSKQNRSVGERFFFVRAKRWLGEHEAALDELGKLAALYPGSRAVVSEAAALDRSLVHTIYTDDPKRSEAAISRYLALAARYPSISEYPTLAGEVMADSGDLPRALKTWDAILDIGRGTPDVYKEVAALYWDYYQFDDAAKALLAIREIRREPLLYAWELAAIYESKGDYAAAIDEYVKRHCADRYGAIDSTTRLTWLAKNKGLGPAIDAAYKKVIAATPGPMPVMAYADYLTMVGRNREALDVYAAALPQATDYEFLEESVRAFGSNARYDLQEKALLRIVETSGEEREDIARLAAFYESRKMWAKAYDAYNKMITTAVDDDAKIDATLELASYFWRREKYGESLLAYRQASDIASGDRRKTLQAELAQRYIERGYLDEASAVLTKLIAENPTDTHFFNTLAVVFTKKNNLDGLASLYKQGVENVKKAPMSREQRKARLFDLRNGLARCYADLGKHTEALDQYIEAINLEPLDEPELDLVYDFAVAHNLLPRLKGYYVKTADEAFKNYRWRVVLARIEARSGNADTAADSYKVAIKLEPQEHWLHEELARLFVVGGRHAEAVKVYEDLAKLSPDPAVWHLKIAEALYRAGRRDEGLARAMKTIEGNPPAHMPYFKLADFLYKWNDYPKAADALAKGVKALKADPSENALDPKEVEIFAKTFVKIEGFAKTFARLKELRSFFAAESTRKDNIRINIVKTSLGSMDWFLGAGMGSLIDRFGSDSDETQLAALYADWSKDDISTAVLDIAQAFAKTSGLYKLEDALAKNWLDANASMFKSNQQRAAYLTVEVEHLRRLYERRDYEAAAIFIGSRPEPSRYAAQLSRLHRVAGNVDGEIRALESILDKASRQSLGGFSGEDPIVRRYVALLVANNRQKELDALTSRADSNTGFYLNELIYHGKKDLALATIAKSCASEGKLWQDSKSALVYAYFNDTNERSMQLFRAVLGVNRIGAAIAPESEILEGRAWTLFGWRYGKHLDTARKPEYDRWLAALVEDSPLSASVYSETGDYEYGKGRFDRALTQYHLALDLSPKASEVVAKSAKSLYKLGKKKDATALLESILDKKSPSTYLLYRDTMAELGEEAAGNDKLAAYVVEMWPVEAGIMFEAVQTLMTAWENDPARKEDLLRKLVASKPGEISICHHAIEQGWLKGQSLNFVYETVISVIEGESPINEALSQEWRTKYQAHLIESGQTARAIELISENERLEVYNAHAAELARAEVYLKSSRLEEAKAELRKYIGAEPVAVSDYDQAIRLFEQYGFTKEAKAWLEEQLKLKIARRSTDINDYARLADLLLEKGDTANARALIDRMLIIAGDAPAGLIKAAEICGKHKLYTNGIKYRERLAALAPEDRFNVFEKIVLVAKSGNAREAWSQTKELLADSETSNALRADIARRLPDAIAADAALLKEAISHTEQLAQSDPRDAHYLLLSNLIRKTGDANRARAVLENAVQRLAYPTLCALELARENSRIGDNLGASNMYRLYLRMEQDDVAVYVELAELELKRRLVPAAIDALPRDYYDDRIDAELQYSDVTVIESAVAARFDSPKARVDFLIAMSDAAVELKRYNDAISLIEAALSVVNSNPNLIAAPPALSQPQRGGFSLFGKKQPAPTTAPQGQGIEAILKAKREAIEKKRNDESDKRYAALRIVENLENEQ